MFVGIVTSRHQCNLAVETEEIVKVTEIRHFQSIERVKKMKLIIFLGR